jgi:hypothetical protein
VAWLDAATASDSVAYKPEVGEVAGSSPTSRSMLFLLFILSSLFFLSSSVSSPSGFWQFLLLVNTIFIYFFIFFRHQVKISSTPLATATSLLTACMHFMPPLRVSMAHATSAHRMHAPGAVDGVLKKYNFIDSKSSYTPAIANTVRGTHGGRRTNRARSFYQENTTTYIPCATRALHRHVCSRQWAGGSTVPAK